MTTRKYIPDDNSLDARGADNRKPNTTRRYVPGMYDTQRIVTEDVYEEDETEEEEYDQPDTVIPRRGSAKLVAPLVLSGTRQPARATRNTEEIQQVKTQQIRVEPAQQPKQPLITRRKLIAAGVLATGSFAAILTGSSFALAKYDEFMNQLASGKFPSDSISGVFGHNHDSEIKRTRLHAWLDTEEGFINFMELPANDASKSKIFQTQSLREMYQGSLSNVKLELILSVVGNVHQVIMQATCLDVAILAEPLVLQWLLLDNGGYFHTAQPK